MSNKIMEPRKIRQREVSTADEFDDSVHPVLKRVFLARDISSNESLDYSLKKLYPFSELKNINAAVELVFDAIRQNKRMLIVADFDADGATSCALGIRGLAALGAKQIEYIVPNRFDYGYGLTPEIVELAADLEPDLIITVDNGISSIDGVAEANRLGIDVLVTDHHLPGEKLPDAKVILNPNQPGDNYPGKSLAGVGVMFNLLIALRAHMREQNWFEQQSIEEPNLAHFLDLVALGTVADLVPLDQNNRILVAQGLARIQKGFCCEGIKALMRLSNRSLRNLKASDLGFSVGPRLNAAGRLTDMSLGIECLLADDESLAMQMASELDELNKERRRIQADMQEQALQGLELEELQDESVKKFGICVYQDDWHQGVVGILASKIKEQYNRPVIAFARENNEMVKGSARSIAGVHIRDVLESINSQHPGLIEKFGGHAMAAGLSMPLGNLEQFMLLFDKEMEKVIEPSHISGEILTDGQLSVTDLSLSLAQQIQQSGPWGQSFPEPVFHGDFRICKRRIVGENHLKLELGCGKKTASIDAIAFNQTDEDWPEALENIHVVYRLESNYFNGRESLQLNIEHIQHDVVSDQPV